MIKKIIIALFLSILILVVFMYGLGALFVNVTGMDIVLLALSINFTIILSTMIIIEKLDKR